ncbi:hypothetical protein ACIA5C_47880 [Actinoplanes sp. NPDC051343]|uniref:hypothetical protein n=1 Tax=Actinoplanes sp. NPDC051343 TaxID=3363906 RepID=UPI003789B7A4
MTDHELVTDSRYPGWRPRLVTDEDAGQPWGDALAPALLVEHGHPGWAGEVYQPEHAGRILQAWRRLDPVVFERYLRLAHGTTAIEQVTDRDLTVIVFDTAGYRTHAGICGTADLSGEYHQWRSWLDGDVYGVLVEHHTGNGCWMHEDSVFGLYGWAYARQYAADLLTETAASPNLAA